MAKAKVKISKNVAEKKRLDTVRHALGRGGAQQALANARRNRSITSGPSHAGHGGGRYHRDRKGRFS